MKSKNKIYSYHPNHFSILVNNNFPRRIIDDNWTKLIMADLVASGI